MSAPNMQRGWLGDAPQSTPQDFGQSQLWLTQPPTQNRKPSGRDTCLHTPQKHYPQRQAIHLLNCFGNDGHDAGNIGPTWPTGIYIKKSSALMNTKTKIAMTSWTRADGSKPNHDIQAHLNMQSSAMAGTSTPKMFKAGDYAREQSEHNYADAANDRDVLLAELRAHGNVERACAASGIEGSTLSKWRKKYSDLDAQVNLAQTFAQSDELSYSKWVTNR